MKTAIKKNVYGAMITAGFVLALCCDTETPEQLLVVCLAGFGLMCFGARKLILMGRG